MKKVKGMLGSPWPVSGIERGVNCLAEAFLKKVPGIGFQQMKHLICECGYVGYQAMIHGYSEADVLRQED